MGNIINEVRHYCAECRRLISRDELSDHKSENIFSFGALLRQHAPDKYNFYMRFPKATSLPSSVDLRPILAAGGFIPFDQGQQGSCTANCGCADRALVEIKQNSYPGPFSRAFLYWEERKLHGWQNQDSGANMEDIGTVFTSLGVCLDKTMPYSQFNYTTAPSSAAIAEATAWEMASQSAITVDQIKQAVYQCSLDINIGSVRIGVPIPQSFMDALTSKPNGGFIPLPTLGENILGGHAMLVVGYDDNMTSPDGKLKGYFIVLNSWGTGVGDKGYIYMPYAWFTSSWVSANGGTDNWQQYDTPSPQPGALVLSLSPTTINNDGSTPINFSVNGVPVGDTLIVGLQDPSGNPLDELYDAVAQAVVVSGTGKYVGTYVGPATGVAGDITKNVASNAIQLTIVKPSVCPVGNSIAEFLNAFATALGRQGRFRYLVG